MRLIVAALLASASLGAQETHSHTGRSGVVREVGSGAIGSFAGLIPVMLFPSCFTYAHYSNDVDCREPVTLGAFVVSPFTTSFGVILSARHNGTPRSKVGAWVGGLAGGVAGVALVNAMSRSGAGSGLTFPTYYLVQSSMSVLGSRLVGGRLQR